MEASLLLTAFSAELLLLNNIYDIIRKITTIKSFELIEVCTMDKNGVRIISLEASEIFQKTAVLVLKKIFLCAILLSALCEICEGGADLND